MGSIDQDMSLSQTTGTTSGFICAETRQRSLVTADRGKTSLPVNRERAADRLEPAH
ncbi:MAG: hypothetical protein LZF60_80330 [Nitrospira sp.]|nr:MAG: hypothetical protein LZF60_80330 [Nitrospira sp.]